MASEATTDLDALHALKERVLEWDGCFNVRDLGGLATTDGRRTRRGELVRSDMLCRLSPSGQQALLDHGVRTIIDMRTPAEVDSDGGGYAWRLALEKGPAALDYQHLSFTAGLDDGAWDRMQATYAAASSREELNQLDLDNNAIGIAAIVGAIADAAPGGIAVHCHAGKDRTGLIVMLLLALVGVSDEDIADDYAMTALNLEPLIEEWLREMTDDDAERERLRRLAEPRREAMLKTIEHMRRHYGSAEEYLLSAGLGTDQLHRIRRRLTEES